MKIDPVNKPVDMASNPGAPVVPASMADQIKPDTDGLAPPGHTRDEQMRERAANLEAQIAAMPDDMAGGVDVSTIDIENEIAQAFDDFGNLSVTKMQPEFVYKWKKADSLVVNLAQKLGFELVQGDMPEGIEHKGKHCAATTTLRGAGDVMLWRIRRARYEAIEEYHRRKAEGMGQVTDRFEDYGQELADQGLTPQNLAHGRRTDPLIQRVFANGPGQARAMTQVLKTGTLRGATTRDLYGR